MMTNSGSGTRVDEIAQGIFRISTPVSAVPGGFTFNQYLVVDDEPLLFHTGLRQMFPLVREAIEAIMPVERLRYVSFSHYEADECGALNDFLAAAPNAVPLCGQIGAMVSIGDMADRPPRALDDGEGVSLGAHTVRWFATPHLPHGWDCGFLMEETTRTLMCGDLFTQGGGGARASDRGRHPRTERSLPGRHGLFFTDQECAGVDRAPRRGKSDDAGLHAWRGVARRRSAPAQGARRTTRRVRPLAKRGASGLTSASAQRRTSTPARL